MRKLSLLVLLLALAAIACAQPSTAPVTKAELRAVTERAALMMRRAWRTEPPRPLPRVGAGPATRADVVNAFDYLFSLAEPQFAFTPRGVGNANPDWKRSGDAALDSKLARLIKFGCISPFGAVATGAESFSTRDIGDAFGYILMRLSNLTHTPSLEFSPYLGGEEEIPGETKSQ